MAKKLPLDELSGAIGAAGTDLIAGLPADRN